MKKQCKIICALTGLLALCLLAACGGNAEKETSAAAPETSASAEAAEPQTTEPETDAPETTEPQTDAPETTAPETDAPQTGGASDGLTSSGAQGEAVGGMENAPASDSAYNTGTWFVEAPGTDPLKMDRLQFEDGVLVAHYYSEPNYGKGSYGPDSPDSVEFSPYYQKTVEEVIALLEGEGRTVTVSQ